MNVFNLKLKDYIKLIAICLGIIALLALIFYLTRGSFFDGLILTCIGLAYTYTILTLFALSVKFIASAFSNDKYQLLPTALIIGLVLVICIYIFKIGFNFLAST